MERLNFYIESANRAYILHLSNDISEQHTVNILCENSNCRDELLKFTKKATLISYECKSKDIPVYVSEIHIEKNVANVVLSEGKEAPKKILAESDDTIFVDNDDSHFFLQNKADMPNDVEKYSIVFSFKDYSGNVCVTCSPAAQIYDVVLDFGSEASQMLIQRRDSSINNEPIELFGNILNHFFGINNYGLNEYNQQDNDRRLFRSVFFSKETNNASILSADFIAAPPSPDDPYVSFISRRDDHEKGARIPNVKLSYLADLRPRGLNIRELHRALVIRFLHEAFWQIAEDEGHQQKKAFAVSITLLLPNVMSQGEVSRFAEDVRFHVNSIPFLSFLPKGLQLSTIDVRTCSESDASLLNWINKQRHIQPGRYLIIDMGKGTTDFSVVHVKSATEAESIFRAGIIGAGNVLSYALLDNYLIHLGGIIGRKTLMKKVLGAEPALLYRIEQAIEKCKRGHTRASVGSMIRVNAETINPEAIAENIEESIPPTDDYSIVYDAIARLVNLEIGRRIKGLTFDYIVLSGRTFLYEPFLNEIKKVLGMLLPHKDIIYDKLDAKKGCLHGPLTPIDISKSSNIVGMPIIVDLTKKGNTGNSDCSIEPLKGLNARKSFDELMKQTIKLINTGMDFAGWSNGKDNDGEQTSEPTSHENALADQRLMEQVQQQRSNELLEIMTNGLKIDNYGKNTRIYISGNAYVPVGGYQMEEGKDYFIYFDSEEFYLRTDDKCLELRHDVTNSENSTLLFESLFPYSVKLLGDDIDIPFAKPIKQR